MNLVDSQDGADAVIDVESNPVTFDIKTTSIAPDKWDAAVATFPKENYKFQVDIYSTLMNDQNYYDKKIEKNGIGTINLLMPAGAEDSEHECYWNLTQERQENIMEFLGKYVAKHRDAWLNGGVEECTSRFCKEHRVG